MIDRATFDIKPPDEAGIGSKERDRRLESLKKTSQDYIHAVLKPAIERHLQAKMPTNRSWTLTEQDSPDGSKMREPYFFGEPPTFEEVLGVVGEFEQQFNQQAKA